MASAKEYTTEKIRNVVVLGHGGAGKTSLIDSLCFTAVDVEAQGQRGRGSRPDDVPRPKRLEPTRCPCSCTPAYCEHMEGTKINLLDTPGFMDFVGETLAAVRVADSAVIVRELPPPASRWARRRFGSTCEDRGIPRLFFVSMMDKEHASFDRVYGEIRSRL